MKGKTHVEFEQPKNLHVKLSIQKAYDIVESLILSDL